MVRYRKDLTGIDTLHLPVFDTAILSARFRFLRRKQRTQAALKLQIPSSSSLGEISTPSTVEEISSSGSEDFGPGTATTLSSWEEATPDVFPVEEQTGTKKRKKGEREYFIEVLQHSGDLGYRDYLNDYMCRRAGPQNESLNKRRRRHVPTPDISKELPTYGDEVQASSLTSFQAAVRYPGRWSQERAG